MVLQCPNCNGALRYDIDSDQLLCQHCNSKLAVWSIKQKENDGSQQENHVYHCTTCSAKLMIDDVETATFCPYCGQPTIVLSRVSNFKKPRYIIPFAIKKQDAIKNIRKWIRKNYLLPRSIRHFKIDDVRGIYVPFSLVDIHYSDRLLIEGTIENGNIYSTKYFAREGYCDFRKITIDTSRKLSNAASNRLEPYNMDGLRDFNSGYLSGFYADCSDDEGSELDYEAYKKASYLFYNRICESVPAISHRILSRKPSCEITSENSAMLPVWFLVFHNKKSIIPLW